MWQESVGVLANEEGYNFGTVINLKGETMILREYSSDKLSDILQGEVTHKIVFALQILFVNSVGIFFVAGICD